MLLAVEDVYSCRGSCHREYISYSKEELGCAVHPDTNVHIKAKT